jgi:hypothetical protein
MMDLAIWLFVIVAVVGSVVAVISLVSRSSARSVEHQVEDRENDPLP